MLDITFFRRLAVLLALMWALWVRDAHALGLLAVVLAGYRLTMRNS